MEQTRGSFYLNDPNDREQYSVDGIVGQNSMSQCLNDLNGGPERHYLTCVVCVLSAGQSIDYADQLNS